MIPFYIDQIKKGLPITITLPEMTCFLLSLDRAVDSVFEAVGNMSRGCTFVSKVASAKVMDIAKALMGDKDLPFVFTGIRPGEKVHEILVSEEECFRTVERGDYFKISPMLAELREEGNFTPALESEYSSVNDNLSIDSPCELSVQSSSDIKHFMAKPHCSG